MSGVFEPHPYQRDAVARILHEPTVLLDHVVGAGKSGTMFMAAMELKRLGLVRQPWIVVPNHIIDQVGREAKQWYPGRPRAHGQRRHRRRGPTPSDRPIGGQRMGHGHRAAQRVHR